MNIGNEVRAVRKLHPMWSFEESWNHVRATHPEFESSTAESNRVAAKQAPLKEKEDDAKFKHVEAIARRLMQRNPRLSFKAALEITRDCLPAVQAEIAAMLRQSVKAAEPKKGRTLLVRGNQAEYID